jgi:hypothetical protein
MPRSSAGTGRCSVARRGRGYIAPAKPNEDDDLPADDRGDEGIEERDAKEERLAQKAARRMKRPIRRSTAQERQSRRRFRYLQERSETRLFSEAVRPPARTERNAAPAANCGG